MEKSRLDHFGKVDASAEASAFITYLDRASSLDFFQAAKRRTYDLLEIREGSRILDVGCGTGDDVRAMAEMAGSGGKVVGVDNSETMITEAIQRSQGSGLPVEFHQADATELPFEDASFSGVRADRVLQHLDEPSRALAEMVRVAEPGARVVVFDPDWATALIDSPYREVTREIANCRADHIRTGWIGRQLYRLFKEAGLLEVKIEPAVLTGTDYTRAKAGMGLQQYAERAADRGLIKQEEAERWLAGLERASEDGLFFVAVTFFMASGRKRG